MITKQTKLTDDDRRLIEWMGRRSEYLKRPAKAVSREEYNEMLEVLPPYIYKISEDITYFVMSEFLTGDVSTCYATRKFHGVPKHICKYVTAESHRITDGMPTHDDFQSVIDDIDQITSAEADIYNDEDMLHACGFAMDYLSGSQRTMINAYKLIKESNAYTVGYAHQIAAEEFEQMFETDEARRLFEFVDDDQFVSSLGWVEMAYCQWINIDRLEAAL